MDPLYNIDDTALNDLNNLISGDFGEILEDDEYDKIEFLQRLATDMANDAVENEVSLTQLYILGKHVEEFGKTLKGVVKKEAIKNFRALVDNTGENSHFICGNKLSLTERSKDEVIPNKKLKRLQTKEDGIKKAIKEEQKRLKKEGGVNKKTPTYSISISKS